MASATTTVTPAPDFVNFPPFYTLQKAEKTKQQQLLLWKNIILKWVQQQGTATITLANFELFENKAINRSLDAPGRLAVAENMIQSGHAQWQDNEQSAIKVTWRTPIEWANMIYKWATDGAMVGSMFTLYELHSADISRGTEFHGMEPELLLQALEKLQENEKVQLYSSGVLDETGVKFL